MFIGLNNEKILHIKTVHYSSKTIIKTKIVLFYFYFYNYFQIYNINLHLLAFEYAVCGNKSLI